MKGLYTALLASAITGAFAAPSPVENGPITERAVAAACATPVTLGSNPFSGRSIYANKEYSKEVIAAASAISDSSLAAAAKKVADVGTFLWL